jgi:hypothetical protein
LDFEGQYKDTILYIKPNYPILGSTDLNLLIKNLNLRQDPSVSLLSIIEQQEEKRNQLSVINLVNIERKRREMVNLISKCLWVASVKEDSIHKIFKLIKHVSIPCLLEYIGNISMAGIRILLNTDYNFKFSNCLKEDHYDLVSFFYDFYEYMTGLPEESLMFLYSMRRATPEPIDSIDFKENLSALQEEPSGNYSVQHIKDLGNAYLFKRKIKMNLYYQPSLVSNKSCIEAGRNKGGRDYVSSIFLKYSKIQSKADDMKFDNLGCDNPMEYQIPFGTFGLEHKGEISYRPSNFTPVDYKYVIREGKIHKTIISQKKIVPGLPNAAILRGVMPIQVPSVEVQTEEVDLIKQFQVEWQVRQQDSFRTFTIANLQMNLININNRPKYLYGLDIKNRGWAHRVPLIPQWHEQIVSAYLGAYTMLAVERLCPTTFKSVNPELSMKSKYYYAGDLKQASNYIPFDNAKAAQSILISRMDVDDEMKEAFEKINEHVHSPHIVTWDKVWREEVQIMYTIEMKNYSQQSADQVEPAGRVPLPPFIKKYFDEQKVTSVKKIFGDKIIMDLFYDDWEPIFREYYSKNKSFEKMYEIWDEKMLIHLMKYDWEYDFGCYSEGEFIDVINSAYWGCAAMRATHPLYKFEENTINRYLLKIKNELLVCLQTGETHPMVKMETLIRDMTHGYIFIRKYNEDPNEDIVRRVFVPLGHNIKFYEKYYDRDTEYIWKSIRASKIVKVKDPETGDTIIRHEKVDQYEVYHGQKRSKKFDIFDSTQRLLELINTITDPNIEILHNGLIRKSPLSLLNSKGMDLGELYHTVFPWFTGLSFENMVILPEPDPEKCFETTQGAYMCLGTTPALLTFLNHIAHFGLYEAKKIKMGDFATVGDDNISGHKTRESIVQLQDAQENVGFKVNYLKSWISEKGYLLAEKLWLKDESKGGFREVNNFKARYFVPKKAGNHWITIPSVAFESLRSASREFRRRAMSVIYHQNKSKYDYCLSAGLNIFETPIHKPMFPMNLFAKKGNYLYEAFVENKQTQIKNIFIPKDYTQDTDRRILKELIDNLPNEGISWSMPTFGRDFNYRPAAKREWKKGDLLNALTARSVNNPYRNPRASQHPQTITEQICVSRFLKLKGEKHLSKGVHNLREWEDERVQTSLMGILSNQANFDMSKIFNNNIYDSLIDVFIFDGRVIEGCSTYKAGEEYKLEQQVIGAVKRNNLFGKNILFLILAPKYGPDVTDRQIVIEDSYFAVWFKRDRRTFQEFCLKCTRTFDSYQNKTLVSNSEELRKALSEKDFRSLYSYEFFDLQPDQELGENIISDSY